MANEKAGGKEGYVLNKLRFAFDSALSVIQDSVKKRQPLDASKDLLDAEDDTSESPKEMEAVQQFSPIQPHELGKYQLPEGLAPKLEDDKTYLLVGSVDRTAFDKKAKREADVLYKDANDNHNVNWYEDVSSTASIFLDYKDHIETNFKSWNSDVKQERLLAILKVVSKMTEFTDAAWKKMIKDNKFTDNEIYGSEGVYNLLLAFNRATESTSTSLEEGFFAAAEGKFAPKVFKIRLDVSGKNGKDDNSRYSRLISTKVIEDNIKIEEEDEGAPAPDAPAPAPDAPDTRTPEEIAEQKTVAEKILELEQNGFTFVKTPTKFDESGYAVYGTDTLNADGNVVEKFAKRLEISIYSDGGIYAELLTLPDGHVLSDKSTEFKAKLDNAVDLKNRLEADDVKEYSDSVKSLYYDLVYAPGYNVTVGDTALTGEDPLTKAPYDPHTYEVTVKDTVIDVGTGADAKRVNVPEAKFQVTLKPGDPMPYTGYVDEKGITGTTNSAGFLKNAVQLYYDEHPTATP